MALQKAAKQVAFAKIGGFGPAGSGKTTVVSMLALHLSKKYHNGAPVAFIDTEKGSDFVQPFFEAEGVQLYVDKTRAFKDLLNFPKQAIELGCCAAITDSGTHFWVELVQAYCRERKVRKPEFQHWKEMKEMWGEFSTAYVNSRLHWMLAGRMGYEWDNVETEPTDGGEAKRELVKTGTKMKVEGEFGYEPDVLCELASVTKDPTAAKLTRVRKSAPIKRKFASNMVHLAAVKKSRVWEMNGQTFEWADRSSYKQGDYAIVGNSFEPYFRFLNIGGEHVGVGSRNSESMMHQETTGGFLAKKTVLEEFRAIMDMILPAGGNSGQAQANKLRRAWLGETITGGITSKTAFERQDIADLKYQVAILKAFRERLKTEGMPEQEADFRALIEIAREEVGDMADVVVGAPQESSELFKNEAEQVF